MDAVDELRQVAVSTALDDADLTAALPRFMRATRDATVMEAAIDHLERELEQSPDGAVLRRARALLMGALRTSIYSHGDAPRRPAPPGGDALVEQVLQHAGDVAIARERVVSALAGLGLGVVDTQCVALVALELMSNAVRHAPPPARVRVERRGRTTFVAVHDPSVHRPAPRHSGEAPGGLGLVELSSRAWGVTLADGGGKEVWAVVPDAPDGPQARTEATPHP